MAELNVDEIAARARQYTGLKWLTSEDTKKLDALAADVTALLALLAERDAEVARLRGLLTYKEHSGAVRCSYCDGFVQDGQVQHKADCAVGKA